ncbi:hypothetical protein D3C86_1203460 [compost metagenome]
MHHDRRAVLLGRADGDLELARQEQEFRVDGRPLPQNFRQRSRVNHFVGRNPGKGFGGDVAHAVAGGLDRMHFHPGQAFENVRHLSQFDPVELHVLPGGEMAVAAIVIPGDARQRTHLPGTQRAVGNRHSQHVGVFLHVQTVLQAQRQEFFLAQLTGQKAFDLITKLRNSFEHQCPVIVVVLIHLATSSELGTEPCRSELARDGRQRKREPPG